VGGGQQAAEPLDLVGAERWCGVDDLADVFGEDFGAVGSGVGGRAAWWAVGFVRWVGGGLVGGGQSRSGASSVTVRGQRWVC
jgi:hypothetical protein